MALIDPKKLKSRQKHSPKVTKVLTPEWEKGGFVFVQRLPATAADQVQSLAAKEVGGKAGPEARSLVAWCIFGMCDERGNPLWTQDDVPWMLKQPLMMLQRIVSVIFELNDITDEVASSRKKN